MLFSTIAGSDIADAATAKCAIPKPCALTENTGTGPASESDANSGPGVLGTTDSGSYLDPAVEGESENPDGSDAAGAFGLTIYAGGAAPAYGVLAYGSVDDAYANCMAAARRSPSNTVSSRDRSATTARGSPPHPTNGSRPSRARR